MTSSLLPFSRLLVRAVAPLLAPDNAGDDPNRIV